MHALLDSESAAAAYRFTIRPGETTVFDVEMAIYPRVDLDRPGLAPMTSMFFFGPNDRMDVDDFRPSVHDSDGLAIFNGRGEELWRPLSNPRDLQISAFADLNPRGFGLMQRQKDFRDYQDLEFELRTAAEPVGRADRRLGRRRGAADRDSDQGRDPRQYRSASGGRRTPLPAKGEHTYTYRLHWGPDVPKPQRWHVFRGPASAQRVKTARLFVLDLIGEKLKSVDPKSIRGVVTAEKAEIRNIVTQPNPATGGWRLSFELSVQGQGPGRTARLR